MPIADPEPVYQHTQPARWILAWVVPLLVLMLALPMRIGYHPLFLTMGVLFALLAVWFSSLTVWVTRDHIGLRFGPGPIVRRFVLDRVVEATRVRNPWYYGWGIRYVPGGWLFNVSGLDAIEIRMVDGRRYRIGTDEPDRLLDAIVRARAAAGLR